MAQRATRTLLRLIGLLCMPSIIAAFMPQEWLVWAVHQVEPATPVLVVMEYLARFLAMFYFLLGMLMLLSASNIERYAPVIYVVLGWIIMCWAVFISASLHYGGALWSSPMYRLIAADVLAGAIVAIALFVLMLRGRAKPTA